MNPSQSSFLTRAMATAGQVILGGSSLDTAAVAPGRRFAGFTPLVDFNISLVEGADLVDGVDPKDATFIIGEYYPMEFTRMVISAGHVICYVSGHAKDTSANKIPDTLPAPVSAEVGEVADDTIVVTFSRDLDPLYKPATTAFVGSGITGNPAVSSITIDGNKVSLELAAAVTAGNTVTLAYTKPTNLNTAIRDLYVKFVASFSGLAVTNNVT